jgi:hypothetical protein
MNLNGKSAETSPSASAEPINLELMVEWMQRYGRARRWILEPEDHGRYIALHVPTFAGKRGRVAFGAGFHTPRILGPYFKYSGSSPPTVRIPGYQPIRATPRYNQLEFGPLQKLEDLALFHELFVIGYDCACP